MDLDDLAVRVAKSRQNLQNLPITKTTIDDILLEDGDSFSIKLKTDRFKHLAITSTGLQGDEDAWFIGFMFRLCEKNPDSPRNPDVISVTVHNGNYLQFYNLYHRYTESGKTCHHKALPRTLAFKNCTWRVLHTDESIELTIQEDQTEKEAMRLGAVDI